MCIYIYIYIWRVVGQNLGVAATSISKEMVKSKGAYLEGLSFKQN